MPKKDAHRQISIADPEDDAAYDAVSVLHNGSSLATCWRHDVAAILLICSQKARSKQAPWG